jgi:hypothetical protein
MSDVPYVAAKFKLSATFETDGGPVVFNDIISMSGSFALNTIPTAQLVVAVGTRVDGLGGTTRATIHTAKKRLKTRDKVTVTVEIIPTGGDTNKLQVGKFVVFKGFYAGIGYQRSHNSANYALRLIHWLDDLNSSSAINGNWFPGVPFDYAQQAVADLQNIAVGTNTVVPTISTNFATVDNLNVDLWKKVIAPIFEQIGKFSSGTLQDRVPTRDVLPERNDAAMNALANMPGSAPNYVPLRLNIAGTFNLANSMAIYFTKTLGESYAQNSFWAKLIGDYAADFLFAISPAVEWALPIPFCGGLRWVPGDKVIMASDYTYANFNGYASQIIESVDVYYPVITETGLIGLGDPPDAKLSFYRPCGVWPELPKNQMHPGLKLFKNAPRWAANIGGAGLQSGMAQENARTTAEPAAGGRELAPGTIKPQDAINQISPIIVNFAKHWYMTEVLNQRYGEMSGKLRFDIAPGTLVKIETPVRDSDLAGGGDEYLYATVMAVSFVINSEKSTAGTSFGIANIRTEEEMSNNTAYSTDTPPLYTDKWSGGPLALVTS